VALTTITLCPRQKQAMVKTVLIVLALSPLLAFAQQEVERANNSPGATSQPQRVEVRGALLRGAELRRREPLAKQLYGREELDKYGDTQLSDILKRLPGINVQGGQLRMRGLGGAYTQVLLNGEPAPPGFSLDNLNPQQVERLEVTKAPTADQSAQAIAGTLNIILKDAPRVVQKDMRLGVQYANEKPGITAGLTYGNSVAGGMGFVLPISTYQWDWRNSFDAERTGGDALGQPQHLSSGGFERSFGHGFNVSPRLNWKLGDDETLSLQGFFVNNRFNSDSENRIELLLGNPPPSVFDVTKNYGEFNTSRLNLQYVNRFSEDRRVELRVGVTRGGADFQFNTLGYDANGAQTVHRTIVGRNRFRGSTLSVKATLNNWSNSCNPAPLMPHGGNVG
jgi:outer membrane receptor for ferrienterochelin and colicins